MSSAASLLLLLAAFTPLLGARSGMYTSEERLPDLCAVQGRLFSSLIKPDSFSRGLVANDTLEVFELDSHRAPKWLEVSKWRLLGVPLERDAGTHTLKLQLSRSPSFRILSVDVRPRICPGVSSSPCGAFSPRLEALFVFPSLPPPRDLSPNDRISLLRLVSPLTPSVPTLSSLGQVLSQEHQILSKHPDNASLPPSAPLVSLTLSCHAWDPVSLDAPPGAVILQSLFSPQLPWVRRRRQTGSPLPIPLPAPLEIELIATETVEPPALLKFLSSSMVTSSLVSTAFLSSAIATSSFTTFLSSSLTTSSISTFLSSSLTTSSISTFLSSSLTTSSISTFLSSSIATSSIASTFSSSSLTTKSLPVLSTFLSRTLITSSIPVSSTFLSSLSVANSSSITIVRASSSFTILSSIMSSFGQMLSSLSAVLSSSQSADLSSLTPQVTRSLTTARSAVLSPSLTSLRTPSTFPSSSDSLQIPSAAFSTQSLSSSQTADTSLSSSVATAVASSSLPPVSSSAVMLSSVVTSSLSSRAASSSAIRIPSASIGSSAASLTGSVIDGSRSPSFQLTPVVTSFTAISSSSIITPASSPASSMVPASSSISSMVPTSSSISSMVPTSSSISSMVPTSSSISSMVPTSSSISSMGPVSSSISSMVPVSRSISSMVPASSSASSMVPTSSSISSMVPTSSSISSMGPVSSSISSMVPASSSASSMVPTSSSISSMVPVSSSISSMVPVSSSISSMVPISISSMVPVSSSAVPTTSPPPNLPVVISNPLSLLVPSPGVVFRYTIPSDTFYDPEGGPISLSLASLVGEVPDWLILSGTEPNYQLVMLPPIDSGGTAFYVALLAADSNNQTVSDVISILPEVFAYPMHSMRITIVTKFTVVLARGILALLSLSESISSVTNTPVRILGLSNGSTVINVSFPEQESPRDCSSLLDIQSKIRHSNGSYTQEFIDAFEGDYPVSQAAPAEGLGACLSGGTVPSTRPLPTLSGPVSSLLPLLASPVLAGLLALSLFLICCLALCCCYRQRRYAGLSPAERKAFLKRRPVVMDSDRPVPPKARRATILPGDLTRIPEEERWLLGPPPPAPLPLATRDPPPFQ